MKRTFHVWTLTLFTGAASHATGILSESFSYPNGPLTEAPASPPWVAHSAPGNGPVLATNGQIRLSGANQESVSVLLPGGPYAASSPAALYSSFKVKVTSSPGFNGTFVAHFKDTNTSAASGFGARIWISSTNAIDGGSLPAGKFRFGIGNGVLATNSSGQINADLSLNTTNLLVTKFVPATGFATLWLNPADESDVSVTANDPGTAGRPNPIDVAAYAFRQATGEGAMLIDDLRVGTTFSDVAGTNNQPVISGIARQRTAAGVSTAVIPFMVSDVETPVENLVVSGSSSNPSLVMDGDIFFGGSGADRTVSITPEPGRQGFTTITLVVTDADGGFSTTSFQLGVGVPTISDIPNQIMAAQAAPQTILFVVSDTETPATGLTVTAVSANQTLLPATNIVLGGSGADRTIALAPASNRTGLASVIVTVSDGTSSASSAFVLTVSPLLGLLRTDDFNRSDGPLVQLDGQWLSNAGSGSTNLQQTRIIGQRLKLTAAQSEDCSTELPPGQPATPVYAPASGTVFYAGLTVNYQKLPNAAGAYFAHFRDGNNGFRGRIYAATAGAAIGHYRLGVANAANSISSAALLPVDLATNQNYSVVLRYNAGTCESRLWLNPASESSPWIDAVDAAQPITVEAFTFRQNSDIGTVWVDDLRIGTAFSDLLPPALLLEVFNGMVQISWPASYTGYILQSSLPRSPLDWSKVQPDPSPSGGNNLVSFPIGTDSYLFRLVK